MYNRISEKKEKPIAKQITIKIAVEIITCFVGICASYALEHSSEIFDALKQAYILLKAFFN